MQWPSFAVETLDWNAPDVEYGPRTTRSRHRGPYASTVPPRIATATLHLDSAAAALVAEVSAEIARLDGEAAATITSFASLLLRTEAASSSHIENLTSSPKAIALAEPRR